MIHSTLQFIANNLNTYLMKALNTTENSVIVSRIFEKNDASNEQIKNKILISYLYLEAEKSIANMPLRKTGGFDIKEHNKNYQLYFIVTMNFDNYVYSLNYMDIVLKFFEENYVFDEIHSMLPSDLAKVIVTPFNIGLNEMLSSEFLMSNTDVTSFIYEARVLANHSESSLTKIENKVV